MKFYTSFALLALVAATAMASVPVRKLNRTVTASDDHPAIIHCRDFADPSPAYHVVPAKRMLQDVADSEPVSGPVGQKRRFSETVSGFMVYWGYVFPYDDAGVAAEMVFDDASQTVYLKNPCSMILSDTYISGKLDNRGITFTLPQVLMESNGEKVYIQRMKKIDYAEGSTFVVDTDTQTVRFNLVDDGSYVMETPADSTMMIMGLTDADGGWYGFGDYAITLTPFDKQPLMRSDLPDEALVGMESWALTYTDGGRMVDVGRDGNNIYIGGLMPSNPDAFVVATTSAYGGELLSEQYMGIDSTSMHLAFFNAANSAVSFDSYGEQTIMFMPVGEAALEVGPSEIKSTEAWTVGFYYSDTDYSASYGYEKPLLRQQPDIISYIPGAPTINNYEPFDPSYGFGVIDLTLSNLNADGYLLNDADYLYWQFIVDGEPYEFSPDEYYNVPDRMIDVPFNYVDFGDFFGSGFHRTLYFYANNYESLGVRMKYKKGVEQYYSPVVYAQEASALSLADVDSGETSVEFYDLAGRRLRGDRQAQGLSIRVERRSDGATSSHLTFGR